MFSDGRTRRRLNGREGSLVRSLFWPSVLLSVVLALLVGFEYQSNTVNGLPDYDFKKVDAGGVVVLDLGAPGVAVSGNITSVDPESPGYFAVFPCNEGQPNTSNLNFGAGGATANGFMVPSDSDGNLCAYSSARSHMLVDISGVSTPETKANLGLKKPVRELDTRSRQKVDAGGVVVLDLGAPGVAVSGNITSVDPESPGYFAVFPCNEGQPNTSNLNFGAGGATANGFMVPSDSDGNLCAYSSARSHMLVDISGVSTPETKANLGLKKPVRELDTRSRQKVDAGGVVVLDLGAPGVAVSGNITSVDPESPGYFAVFPCNEGQPNTSNLNFGAGGATANGFMVPSDSDGNLCAYSSARSHMLVDISGVSTPETKANLGLKKPVRKLDSRLNDDNNPIGQYITVLLDPPELVYMDWEGLVGPVNGFYPVYEIIRYNGRVNCYLNFDYTGSGGPDSGKAFSPCPL